MTFIVFLTTCKIFKTPHPFPRPVYKNWLYHYHILFSDNFLIGVLFSIVFCRTQVYRSRRYQAEIWARNIVSFYISNVQMTNKKLKSTLFTQVFLNYLKSYECKCLYPSVWAQTTIVLFFRVNNIRLSPPKYYFILFILIYCKNQWWTRFYDVIVFESKEMFWCREY